MPNQFLKLRRSAVQGKIPETSSLDLGELAINTYEGQLFLKKSGSQGEIVTVVGSTGSFTGSFTGNGAGLTNIPASGITGLNLSRIATGSISASVNTDISSSFRLTSGSNTLLNVTRDGQLWLGNGSFVNQGYQLDVNGPFRTTVGGNVLELRSNGFAYVSRMYFLGDALYNSSNQPSLGIGSRMYMEANTGIDFSWGNLVQGNFIFKTTVATNNSVGGTKPSFIVSHTLNDGASSTLGEFRSVNITDVINMTSFPLSTYRALFISPTIASLSTNVVAIQNVIGNNLFNTTSGSTGVGVSSINASAKLQIDSTTQGFLPTRTNSTASITSPAQGLLTYITASGDTEGLWQYRTGSNGWVQFLHNSSSIPASSIIGLNLSRIATGSITASVNNTDISASFRVTSGSNTLLNVTRDGFIWIGNGSFVNQGYQLDVNGTARVSGNMDIGTTATASAITLPQTSGFTDFVITNFNTAGVGVRFRNPAGTRTVTISGGNLDINTSNGTISAQVLSSQQITIGSATTTSIRGFNLATLDLNGDNVLLYSRTGTASPIRILSGNASATSKGTVYISDYSNVAGAINSSAQLQIDSTVQGFLTPRMTEAQRLAIATPAQGLIVYDTGSVTEGLWIYNSGSNPGWQEVLTNSGSQSISGSITANSITVTGTLTAQTIVAQTITSSTDFVTGSTRFGSLLSNTHQFTGSVSITGSLTLPYLSTGSVLFVGSNSAISQNNSNFFWNSTNNNLGIGSNSVNSAYKLGVSGDVVISGTNPFLAFNTATNNGSTPAYIQFINSTSIFNILSTGAIDFYSNANQRMRLYSGGNFAIGGTFPNDSGQRLQVYGDTFMKGSSNASATNALLVQNSDSTNLLTVRNDGLFSFFRPLTGSAAIATFYGYQAPYQLEASIEVGMQSSNECVSVLGGSNIFGTRGGFLQTKNGERAISFDSLGRVSIANGQILNSSYSALTIGASTGNIGTIDTNLIGLQLSVLTKNIVYVGSNVSPLNYVSFNHFASSSLRANVLQQTYTNASTVYIEGAPTSGQNVTFTNRWSLFVNSGDNYLAGKLLIGTTTVGTFALDVNGAARISGSLSINNAQFNNTSSLTSAGITTVSQLSTSSYTSCFYNYTVASASNARSGQVMTVWNGSTLTYTEVVTTDIGNTSQVAVSSSLSGGFVRLQVSASSGWTFKNISNLL